MNLNPSIHPPSFSAAYLVLEHKGCREQRRPVLFQFICMCIPAFLELGLYNESYSDLLLVFLLINAGMQTYLEFFLIICTSKQHLLSTVSLHFLVISITCFFGCIFGIFSLINLNIQFIKCVYII